MKRFFIAGAVALAFSTTAQAVDSVKIGVLMGFTGPIESLTVGIAGGAKLALQEVTDSKRLLSGYPGGIKLEAVDADTTCVDAAVATSAAERLVNSETW